MGNCCSIIRFRRRSTHINPKNVTLLLVGLDNAGKTTIAKRLSEEPLDGVVPTVGFSRISLQEKGCSITIYDLGGGSQIRDIWPRYYADVHGVIFVIDASDTVRINECRKALEGILLDSYISGKPILLLANKQDVEGALDEIDIVDRLNVERLVNQQKCPTLVELCSARHFSRKMDVGIDNGYRWLLRCISKDYPSLNNRVLKDLATQEELERIKRIQKMERIRKRQKQEQEVGEVQDEDEMTNINHLQDSKDNKPHQNGIIKMVDEVSIPGQIEDTSNTTISMENMVTHSMSYSTQFFNYEKQNSDIDISQNIQQTYVKKNFLARPKSSGPRLGTDSNKKKSRRKSYQRNNKTAPNPNVDFSLGPLPSLPKIFDPECATQINPFTQQFENQENFPPEQRRDFLHVPNVERARELRVTSKSTPNSRNTSASYVGKRCTSSDQVSNLSKLGKLPPLKIPGQNSLGQHLILDVTQLQL